MLGCHFFCDLASEGPVIIMHQLKSIYNSLFKDSHSHPLHTCFTMIASNVFWKKLQVRGHLWNSFLTTASMPLYGFISVSKMDFKSVLVTLTINWEKPRVKE